MSDDVPRPEPAPSVAVDGATVRRVLRWLPLAMAGQLFVGVPALMISLVVAYGTYQQAQATQKMQQASTWPFVAVVNTNYTPEGRHRVSLSLANNGLGPALLGPIEVRYKGRAMRSPQQLLAACCGYAPGKPVQLATSPASRVALRPGERIAFFEIDDIPANAALLPRLDEERLRVSVRSCYCSIFDDCWTVEGTQSTPRPVAACPTDWAAYRER